MKGTQANMIVLSETCPIVERAMESLTIEKSRLRIYLNIYRNAPSTKINQNSSLLTSF